MTREQLVNILLALRVSPDDVRFAAEVLAGADKPKPARKPRRMTKRDLERMEQRLLRAGVRLEGPKR